MATPGQFVRALADVLGVPEATVAQHDRNLLMAGLRSKRGRGWAAPTVTARDAAHLLTAILGSAQVKESADTVRRHTATRARRHSLTGELYESAGIKRLAALPADHNFVDALEALLVGVSSKLDDDEPVEPTDISIEVVSPGIDATITVGKALVDYVSLNTPKTYLYRQREMVKGAKRRIVDADLEQRRDITGTTIIKAVEWLVPEERYTEEERNGDD